MKKLGIIGFMLIFLSMNLGLTNATSTASQSSENGNSFEVKTNEGELVGIIQNDVSDLSYYVDDQEKIHIDWFGTKGYIEDTSLLETWSLELYGEDRDTVEETTEVVLDQEYTFEAIDETVMLEGIVFEDQAVKIKDQEDASYIATLGGHDVILTPSPAGDQEAEATNEENESLEEEPSSNEEGQDTNSSNNAEALSDSEEEVAEKESTTEANQENGDNSGTSTDDNEQVVKEETEQNATVETKESEEENQEEEAGTTVALQSVDDSSFTSAEEYNTNYFRVLTDHIKVFDNRTGSLVEVGLLEKDETYVRISSYGESWHKIQYGDHFGYVHARHTEPSSSSAIGNEGSGYSQGARTFTAKEDIAVYDNTSGSLVKFGEVQAGQTYPIVSDYGNWYRVLFSDRIGYVSKSGVDVSFTSADTYFQVTESELPVYKNQNGDLKKVGNVTKGQVYPRISSYGPSWHKIQFGKEQGYVYSQGTVPVSGNSLKNKNVNYQMSDRVLKVDREVHVYDNSSGSLVSFGKIAEGQEYAIVGNYGNWYRILFSDRIGYISKDHVTVSFSKENTHFEVVSNNMPVYDNSGGSLKQVGELTKGQVYPRISAYGSNWHRIQFGRSYGYVYVDGTSPASASAVKNENQGMSHSSQNLTVKSDAKIYDNSTGKLVEFGEVKAGKSYPIVSDYGNWYRVLLSDRVGYMNKENVTVSFSASDRYFRVDMENLPLYENRNGSLVDIGSLEQGQTFKRERAYGNWHEVKIGDKKGYVWAVGTSPSNRNELNNLLGNEKNYNISADVTSTATIYDNSSGKLVKMGEIKEGTELQLMGAYGSNWYKVSYSGRLGFLSSDAISVNSQEIVQGKQIYSYNQMLLDIKALKTMYPSLIEEKVIGESVEGRNIVAVKLGNGSKEIMINGSHHAREHMTTNVVMKMLDSYAYAYDRDQKIDGYDVRALLNDVSIWFVPMVNPDGVMLVQEGLSSTKNPIKMIGLNNNSRNFDSWKANINGVDLNRQYPALWDNISALNSGGPRSEGFKGYFPLSEPEARAVYNFTNQHNFATAVAYHSSGEVIYSRLRANPQTRSVTNIVSDKTGYRVIDLSNSSSGGGFSDWFALEKGQAGITPEISPYVVGAPVPLSNWNKIWSQNYSVGIALAKEAVNR
ncbi:M14 family zinc carboxypeptidase [Salipaludibacillus sp. CF4.18]|uniref:M14 family zinc carboxypeptidase n=1 Tax=Salipaludibacillus sp. CF4.18 TaxID=3373081 RepID=UPI003EE66A6B